MGVEIIEDLSADHTVIDYSLGTALAIPRLIDTIDVRPELARIAVPTLVISTTQDNLVTPYHHPTLPRASSAQYAELLAAGPLPFVEAPQEWIRLIRASSRIRRGRRRRFRRRWRPRRLRPGRLGRRTATG